MADKATLIQRVKKLLALAKSPNEYEAKLALERAQELMLRYKLDQSEVERTAEKQGNPLEGRVVMHRKLSTVQERLATSSVFKHFQVKVFRERLDGGVRKVYFIGRESDVAVAEYVFGYLHQTCEKLWRAYHRVYPEAKASAYIDGFVTGLVEQLEAHGCDLEQAAGREKFALVVLNGLREADTHFQQLFPNVRLGAPSRRTAGDARARGAGYDAGQAVTINRGVTNNVKRLT